MEISHMRRLHSLVLLTALAISLPFSSPANAESTRTDGTLSLAQGERMAADLKQGMSPDEVQKLFGKPSQTALKSDANATNVPSKGTLQWTYVFVSSSDQRSLRVEFAAKSLEDWYVNSWDWTAH
jgi:hypothetical protein